VTKKRSADVADKDEEWDGPVEEASVPIAERMETLEAGGTPEEIVTEAVPPIEERVARLERIAEYLHEARQEAALLANSVDTLAEATKALTNLLVTIESQQKSIESLGLRADTAETGAEKFRRRVVKRALAIGLGLASILAVGGVLVWNQEQTLERIEAESKARGLANCESSNESRAALRAFVMAVVQSDDRPDRDDERNAEVVRLAEEAFPPRDCPAELAEAEDG